MLCKKCYREIETDMKYCPHCGVSTDEIMKEEKEKVTKKKEDKIRTIKIILFSIAIAFLARFLYIRVTLYIEFGPYKISGYMKERICDSSCDGTCMGHTTYYYRLVEYKTKEGAKAEFKYYTRNSLISQIKYHKKGNTN